MYAQLRQVSLQHPVVKVTSAKVKDNVKDVDEVGQVVQREPEDQVRGSVDLVEGEAINDDPEVIDECQTDHK